MYNIYTSIISGTTVKFVLEQDKAAFIKLIGVSVLQSAASSFVAPSLRYLLLVSKGGVCMMHGYVISVQYNYILHAHMYWSKLFLLEYRKLVIWCQRKWICYMSEIIFVIKLQYISVISWKSIRGWLVCRNQIKRMV